MSAMPGLTWDPALKLYRGPIEAARLVCDLLQAAGVYQVEWQHAAAYVSPGPLGLDLAPFRDYQADGISWAAAALRRTGGALLADEMGLGKSAQAIATFDAIMPSGVIVIVCPAIVVHHWEAQITRWGTHFGTEVPLPDELPSRKAERAPVLESQRRWVVMSHDIARARQLAGTFPIAAGVVLDEIHAYCDPRNKRTSAMREWREGSGAGVPVLGMTGTPMPAYVRQLWSPLDLLHPGRWGSKWKFERRYANGHTQELQVGDRKRDIWVADGVTHADELATRLQAVMLRRLKADVALELPPLTRQIIEVDPSKREEAAADVEADDLPPVPGAHIRDALAAAEGRKLSHCLDLAREVIAAGGRPLILTLRRSSASWLASRLGVEAVTGDTPAQDRAATLQVDGAPCGVATLASVTTGIDLISFDTVIMAGLDWVPSTMLQGEARAHRLGQLRSVVVYYLVALGTVDEAVRERVIDRLDTFATLMGGDATNGMGETLRGGSVDELLASLAAQIMGEAA
jgi:SNF2 family DNA or RNA helicase